MRFLSGSELNQPDSGTIFQNCFGGSGGRKGGGEDTITNAVHTFQPMFWLWPIYSRNARGTLLYVRSNLGAGVGVGGRGGKSWTAREQFVERGGGEWAVLGRGEDT